MNNSCHKPVSKTGFLCNNSSESGKSIVTIYNLDGTPYLKFSLLSDTNPKFNQSFRPYAINIPEDIFVIEVLAEDENVYKVAIGEGQEKYIKKIDSSLKYYSFEEFILEYDYFSIKYDHLKNPIYKSLSENDSIISEKQVYGFEIRGIEIKDDWLKVSIRDVESYNGEEKTGWLRWKQNEKLLIGFNFTY